MTRLLHSVGTSRQVPISLLAPILLVALALLVGIRWSPPSRGWENQRDSMQRPLPPPAPTAGTAAWRRYYRSYDLGAARVVATMTYAPTIARATATVRALVPQPRALPVDPTRPISAPAPVATPRSNPAARTR